MKGKYLVLIGLLTIASLLSHSCREKNYITYYNKVNEIDSILRYEHDTLLVVEKYRELFKKYAPKDQERIEEFKTFITLADKKGLDFGEKKALRKLAYLHAYSGNSYKRFQDLYDKYGLDEEDVEKEVVKWRKNLNKKLVDTFSMAFARNEIHQRADPAIYTRYDIADSKVLKWTFENYGYPSRDRIGMMGNDNVFMPMDNHLSHLITSEYYPMFKEELLKAVKAGECPPRNYAVFVDKHDVLILNKNPMYGIYEANHSVIDTVSVNYNRRQIGLPSLTHRNLLAKN